MPALATYQPRDCLVARDVLVTAALELWQGLETESNDHAMGELVEIFTGACALYCALQGPRMTAPSAVPRRRSRRDVPGAAYEQMAGGRI